MSVVDGNLLRKSSGMKTFVKSRLVTMLNSLHCLYVKFIHVMKMFDTEYFDTPNMRLSSKFDVSCFNFIRVIITNLRLKTDRNDEYC